MPLPAWAKVHIDKNANVRKDWEPTTARSEELLRQRSVHHWTQRLNQAQRKTWEDLCQDGLDRFQEFCQIKESLDENDASNAVITLTTPHQQSTSSSGLLLLDKDDGGDGNHDNTSFQRFALEPSTEYPSELLPCLIINPPPSCKLDRQALMHSLYQSQKKKTRKRKSHDPGSGTRNTASATILLPRLLPTLRQTLSLIWRQIIQQEPNRSLTRFASKRFNKTNQRNTQSLQKWILWWASRTEYFDQLVILLEDPGGFAETEVRQAFYRCVADWRKEDGVPVSLMVMGTHEQVRDICLLEARIQVMSVPLLTDHGQSKWICQFLHNLILENNNNILPPPVKWGKMMTTLLEDFQYHHGSCSSFVQEFRAHVVQFFAISKGSFAWDLPVDQDRWHLMAWFCTYEGAKEYLENSDSGREKYKAMDQCVRMQHQLQHYWKGMILGLPLFMRFGKNEMEHPIRARETIPILASLYQWSKERKTSEESSPSPLKELVQLQEFLDPNHQVNEIVFEKNDEPMQAIKTIVQELIILVHAYDGKPEQVGEARHDDVDKEMINAGLINMIQELCNLMEEQIDSWHDLWMERCPLIVLENKTSLNNINNHVCIRRETIEDLPQPAKMMYALLQDRLSIKREDWLYDFGGSADDFTLGVWMLTVAGLVQWKRIRGGGILYEKVAVVWTSKP